MRLETNRATGFSASPGPLYRRPRLLRAEASGSRDGNWHIDKKGVAYLGPTSSKDRASVALRPMLGCAGCPANKAAIPTTFPDNWRQHGYNGMGAGATVMLPVFEPGALFFLGDGHARQGDGEVVGSAIETSLDVEFSVDIVKQKKINWPRLENQDFIMVLGSSRAINEALQHSTTELMRWLMESYGFDERGASLLLGQAMEYEISNVVDPEFTIVAKMRKRYLGPPALGGHRSPSASISRLLRHWISTSPRASAAPVSSFRRVRCGGDYRIPAPLKPGRVFELPRCNAQRWRLLIVNRPLAGRVTTGREAPKMNLTCRRPGTPGPRFNPFFAKIRSNQRRASSSPTRCRTGDHLHQIPPITLVSCASTIELFELCIMSVETTGSSVYARMPFSAPKAASFSA